MLRDAYRRRDTSPRRGGDPVNQVMTTTVRHLAIASMFCLAAGCSNVPQEVVDLSKVVGEDMAALHESYRDLIRQRFSDIRQQRLAWVNDVWAPRFLEKFIERGRLVEIATGKVVFDSDKGTFVKPTPGKEKVELLDSVQSWAEEAIFQIEEKRKKLVEPVNKDEKDLLASVDQAFANIFRGNAVITAHLNSLRKVQASQDDVLKDLNLKDLRLKINSQLAAASKKAELTTNEISDLEKDLKDAIPTIEKVKGKLRK
jgi:hypothetical protein